MIETCIDRIVGEEYCTFTTCEKKLIKQVKQWKKEYPDEVDIRVINEDGSLVVRLPYNWFRDPKPPTKRRKLTDEEKIQRKELLKKAREARGNNDDN